MTPANSQGSPAGCQGAANGKEPVLRDDVGQGRRQDVHVRALPRPAIRRCVPPRPPARRPPALPIRRCTGWVEAGYPVPLPTAPTSPGARQVRRVPLRRSEEPRNSRRRGPPSDRRGKRMERRSARFGGPAAASQPRRHPLVIGRRRSRPNALAVILTPGGAWRRLYSLRSTMWATLFTRARS